MIKTLLDIYAGILNTKHRLMIGWLMVINTFAAGFEALSIYMFVPILAFFRDPNNYNPEDTLPLVLSDFINSFSNIGLGTFAVAISVFLSKAILMCVISFGKNNIISTIRRDLSIAVFAGSVFQDYERIVNTKVAVLINNVTAGISHLSNGILFSSISIVIELFMIVGIVFLLVYHNSLIALFVPIIVGIVCLILILLFKKWANLIGQIRQTAEVNRLQVLKDSLGSILEVKIYKAENHFKNLFDKEEEALRRAGIGSLTMAEVPKYILELLGVLIIFLFFIVSYKMGDAQTLLMRNGLFAVAVVKLLPSLNRIIVSYNTMRSSIYAYQDVATVFSASLLNNCPQKTSTVEPTFENISSLKINRLSYYFQSDKKPVIPEINIELERGNIYCLIGPSGSGKTTFLNLISGVLSTTNNNTEYLLNNCSVKKYGDEIHHHIGYVTQSPRMLNRSIKENVAFDHDVEIIDQERVEKALIAAEAMSFVNALPGGINYILSDDGMNLSGGQRQRIALARALYRKPSIIILDEATNALDKKTMNEFMETIRFLSKDAIVIFVSHSDDMMVFCDSVISPSEGNA